MPFIKMRTGQFFILFFFFWIFFPNHALADTPISGKWASSTFDFPGYVYSDANWHLRNSQTTGLATTTFSYGVAGDQFISCDWNGDLIDSPGIFRNGAWFLKNSNSAGAPNITFSFGQAGDIAVCGDWNRDFTDTIGIFRNGTWYLKNTNSAGAPDLTFSFGQAGDIPLAGDWNGDSFDSIGHFRSGTWFLRNSNGAGAPDFTFSYGLGSDIPVVGDWDGNGTYTPGLLRGVTWYLRNSNSAGSPNTTFNFPQAPPTATPTITPTSAPPYSVHFGLGLLGGAAEKWFQTESGDVHAQNEITNLLPASLPAGQNYLSLAGSQLRPGLVSHGSATQPDFGAGNAVSQTGWLIKSQTYPVTHNYDYFAAKLTAIGQPLPAASNVCDSSGVLNENTINTTGGILFCNTNATVQTLNISPNIVSTVFINGNLTIAPSAANQKIKVQKTGFLAFIVKGTITVNANVGTASTPHADPDLEGVYLSDGQFITQAVAVGNDNQLVVKGTVIAWGGVSLNRKLLNNGLYPAHRFIYDPAMARFAPNLMTNTPVHWQQLPP